MKLPRVIGITGHINSGKSMMADYLVAEHGYARFECSDVLCDLYERINGYTTPHTPGSSAWREAWDDYKANPDVRYQLQQMGNWARETFGPSALLYPAFTHAGTRGPVVIGGVRNEQEAGAIFDQGMLLGVVRPDGETVGTHPAEQQIDDILVRLDDLTDGDGIYTNDGTPEDAFLWLDDKLLEYHMAMGGDCVEC